jgi:hypothetical protein
VPVLIDCDHSAVEENMIIWAEAEHVSGNIRSIVGATQRLNMGRFRVEPSNNLKLNPADLASVSVNHLDLGNVFL